MKTIYDTSATTQPNTPPDNTQVARQEAIKQISEQEIEWQVRGPSHG